MKQAGHPVIGIITLLGVALGIAGCGSSTSVASSDEIAPAPAESPESPETATAEATGQATGPEVVERAPSTSEQLQIVEAKAWPDGTGEWLYAVIVENPSDELAYFSDRFDVQVVDADDTIVESESTYVTVPPASRAVVDGSLRNLDGLGAEALTVVAPETATVVEPGSIGHLEVSDIGLSTDDGHEALVGTVTSHFAETQTDPWLTAIFRDPSGEIAHIAGGGIFDDVEPGEDLEFSVLMEAPDGTVPEVYAVSYPTVPDPTSMRSADHS